MGAEQSVPIDENAPPQEAAASGTTREVAWTAAAGDGEAPSPRVGAGGPVGNSLVLVGGHGQAEELADVWSLTSGAWCRLEPEGRAPRPRGGHTVVSAEGVGLIVFGGLSHDRGYLSDVHHLAGSEACSLAWTPVCTTGELPVGRDKHSAVAAAGGTSMLVFGGFGVKPPEEEDDDDDDDEEEGEGEGGGEEGEGEESSKKPGPSVDMGWFDDVYMLDVATWRWRKMPKAAAPAAHPPAAAGGGVWGKLAAKAAAAAPTAPSARAAHACCVLGSGEDECMLLFGGRAATGRLNDLWTLAGYAGGGPGSSGASGAALSAAWKQPAVGGAPPVARSFHACVRVGAGTFAAIVGGIDVHNRHLDEVHLLHTPASGGWAWHKVRQASIGRPPPRASPLVACIADASGGGAATTSLITFGGSSGWSEHGDTRFHSDTSVLALGDVLAAIADGGADADAAVAAPTCGGAVGAPDETEHPEVEPASKRAKTTVDAPPLVFDFAAVGAK